MYKLMSRISTNFFQTKNEMPDLFADFVYIQFFFEVLYCTNSILFKLKVSRINTLVLIVHAAR